MGPATLEIFDFDWTLFRSPPPPERTPRKTFLHSPISLEPPHVPYRPGSSFWIDEIVREFKTAQRRRDSVTALITARRAKTEGRIIELLEQRNIDPDFAFFRSASFKKDKDRVHFKRKRTLELLETYPSIKTVVVWEDEPEQIASIKDLSKRRRVKFQGHLVTEPGGLHL